VKDQHRVDILCAELDSLEIIINKLRSMHFFTATGIADGNLSEIDPIFNYIQWQYASEAGHPAAVRLLRRQVATATASNYTDINVTYNQERGSFAINGQYFAASGHVGVLIHAVQSIGDCLVIHEDSQGGKRVWAMKIMTKAGKEAWIAAKNNQLIEVEDHIIVYTEEEIGELEIQLKSNYEKEQELLESYEEADGAFMNFDAKRLKHFGEAHEEQRCRTVELRQKVEALRKIKFLPYRHGKIKVHPQRWAE